MDYGSLKALAEPDCYARVRLGFGLYPWQENILRAMSPRGSRVAVRTCNEAGKTSTLVLALCLWHMETFSGSLTVTTSGSYRQIKDQLFPHLQNWGGRLGAGWEFGDCWGRHSGTGSRLVSFSTDNPGKAEGWHEPPRQAGAILGRDNPLNRTERFKRQNTARPVYDGAPNLVDPLIDDMVRELKQSCVTVLWQAPRLAQFIGLDPVAVEYAEAAEAVFDFHLRHGCKTRARVSQIVDDELTFGFGVAKLVEAPGRGVLPVPDFLPVSPLSVVVPTATGEFSEAGRVCHMMKYTRDEFRRAAAANGWDDETARLVLATVLVKKAGSDQSGTVYAMRDIGEDRARFRDSALANSQTMVDVWEVYYETADLGRRVCCFCPQFPDLVLSDRPWTWVALIGAESEPPVREWPFVQFRNEDATGFYNTRGIPEILEVDQKEASTYRTTRAIAIDFAGKPFLSGHRRSTPFRFRAGEFLDGMEIVWAKNPGVDHVYQQDYSRNLAMKRVGSTQGAIASVAGADQRKTATEVNAMMSAANGMSTDAVDRFAEPFAQLFSMMWLHMSRHARAQGGKTGLTLAGGAVLAHPAWSGEYCISTGVSGRSVNQHRTLASLTNMGQLAPVIESMTQTLGPESVKAFMLWIFNTVDTELARRIQSGAEKKTEASSQKPE